jgi:beta-galactosidase
VDVRGGKLVISFPHVAAGQAVISALAIATTVAGMKPGPPSPVLVQRATGLEPAYDSRPMTTYKAVNARVSGDTTEWDMAVGVGDVYSLTVKYRYLPVHEGVGKLEVRMPDGTLIKEESVRLLPTPANKWNYITTSTGTMINAGHYKVMLITGTGEGFKVDELQVQ